MFILRILLLALLTAGGVHYLRIAWKATGQPDNRRVWSALGLAFLCLVPLCWILYGIIWDF